MDIQYNWISQALCIPKEKKKYQSILPYLKKIEELSSFGLLGREQNLCRGLHPYISDYNDRKDILKDLSTYSRYPFHNPFICKFSF